MPATPSPAAPPAPLALPERLRTIFVDLDGVLADFHSAAARLWGLDPATLSQADWAQVGEWGLSVPKPDFWARVEAQGEAFWANLEPLPWAQELWDACHAACDGVVVLTSPAPFAASAAGKYAWVREHLDTKDMLIGRPKHVCAAPGRVLIDDRASYGPAWSREGGTLVSLHRPWNPSGHPPEAVIEALRAHA